MAKMIKMKDLLKESTWNNRKFGEPLPTMADYKKSHEEKLKEDKNPCWKGYKQVGMKDKGGKQVPNCVPIDEIDEGKINQSKVTQSFTRAVAAIRKISRKLNDDDNYAFIQKLEKWLR